MVSLNRNLKMGPACADAMRKLGYEYRGNGGISGRHYYRKGNPHTHHIHMWVESNPELGNILDFAISCGRTRLKRKLTRCSKRNLAERFVSDTLSYSLAKKTNSASALIGWRVGEE